MYTKYRETDADIIIVGAGLSGLSAAFFILEQEPTINILILEANDLQIRTIALIFLRHESFRTPPYFTNLPQTATGTVAVYIYDTLSGDRIGGRTLSIPITAGHIHQMGMFDLGGQFISKSEVHLMNLLQKLNIKTGEKDNDNNKLIGELRPGQTDTCKSSALNLVHTVHKYEFNMFLEKLEAISDNILLSDQSSLLKNIQYDSVILDNYIEANVYDIVAKNLLRNIVKTTCGVDPSEMSLLFYLAFFNNGAVRFSTQHLNKTWIEGGAQLICDTLANRLGAKYIKKGEPVFDITRSDDSVVVETDNKKYRCYHVIIAVPPRDILSINFVPPLPRSRMQMLGQVNPGHVVKFVVTYRKAFWKEQGFSGDIVACGKMFSKGPIHLCWDITTKNRPALTGIIGVPDCLDRPEPGSRNSYYDFKEGVLKHLAHHFGEDALYPLEYVEKLWWDEPYISGCPMSCPAIGTFTRYHEIRRPLGRIFWAGAETATNWNGSLGGAVQAGYRAAMELLYDFRPQSLSVADIAFINPPLRQKYKTKPTSVARKVLSYKVIIPVVLVVLYICIRIKRKG